MDLGNILNQLRRERDHVSEVIAELERSMASHKQPGGPRLFLVQQRDKPDDNEMCVERRKQRYV
jgi:hypothetical protein